MLAPGHTLAQQLFLLGIEVLLTVVIELIDSWFFDQTDCEIPSVECNLGMVGCGDSC